MAARHFGEPGAGPGARVAARNVPGEIAVLWRLPLEPGTRCAITHMARSLIAGVGAVAVFTIGGQWSQVQALGVGLGFSLQEIRRKLVHVRS
ncbi:MAG: hypothetical protein ACREA0_10955, partial [bacterium]